MYVSLNTKVIYLLSGLVFSSLGDDPNIRLFVLFIWVRFSEIPLLIGSKTDLMTSKYANVGV
jgi:hypothetical protein